MNHISSSLWHSLKPHVYTIYAHSTWTIGDGKSIFFWTNKWLHRLIVNLWNIPAHLHNTLNMRLEVYLWEGRWNLPDFFLQKDPLLHQLISSLALPSVPTANQLNWTKSTNGLLANKLAYTHHKGSFPMLPW
jgi:hypothetical protein